MPLTFKINYIKKLSGVYCTLLILIGGCTTPLSGAPSFAAFTTTKPPKQYPVAATFDISA